MQPKGQNPFPTSDLWLVPDPSCSLWHFLLERPKVARRGPNALEDQDPLKATLMARSDLVLRCSASPLHRLT